MIGSIVYPWVEHDLVMIEDGGPLSPSQHPNHPVPLEHSGPLPGVQHLGALGPGVVLQPPPVALFTDCIVLTRKLASNFEL